MYTWWWSYKTAGQDVLETTKKKGWPLCWSCAMHGGLQKSKTGTALDSRWEQKLRSTMHYMARYNLGRYWLDWHEDVCLKAMASSEKSAGFCSVFVRKLRVLVRFSWPFWYYVGIELSKTRISFYNRLTSEEIMLKLFAILLHMQF